jgi:ABC-type dipeptide/oligopeptide/nickel transport system permease component
MNRKTLSKIFRFTLTSLLFAFLAIYFSQKTGYVEYASRKQSQLTEKQIKQFEKDVAEGKEIDLKQYINQNYDNYQNKLSNINLKVSEITEKSISTIIQKSFKIIGKMAE